MISAVFGNEQMCARLPRRSTSHVVRERGDAKQIETRGEHQFSGSSRTRRVGSSSWPHRVLLTQYQTTSRKKPVKVPASSNR